MRLQVRNVSRSRPASRLARRRLRARRGHERGRLSGARRGPQSSGRRGLARCPGRSNQGAGNADRRRWRVWLALAIRSRGTLALPDGDNHFILDHDAARQERGYHHAVGTALRAPSRRHPHYRSGATFPARARHGAAAEKILDGRHQTLSIGLTHPLHRMLRQRSHRMAKADAQDRSGHPRAAEHLRVDRRAVLQHRSRSRVAGRRRLGAGGRGGLCGDDAQHSSGEAADRRASCLRAERRGVAARGKAIRSA